MKLFIVMLLQTLLFLPITAFASEGVVPTAQDQNKTEVSASQKAMAIKAYGKLPLYFIENKGQVDEKVSFYERGAGHATFFTSKGVVLSLTKREGKPDKSSSYEGLKDLEVKKNKKVTREAVSLFFVEANKKAKITTSVTMPGKVNYFVGNDKSKWHTNIPTFGAITYEDVYKNIDIKFYGTDRRLEHDVIVRPGGDFAKVKFAYRGIKGLRITESGALEVNLKNGKIIEQRPLIYQEIKGKRVVVDGSYKILKGEEGTFTYGFTVASYDKTKDLVIDPVLIYSTYLGGLMDDAGVDIFVDSTGAAYIAGTVTPPGGGAGMPAFNLIPGVIGGGADVFVTKIDPTGTAFVYSTLFGGTFDDNAAGISVDSAGAAYVTGMTNSADFPLVNPIQGALSGVLDAFVTEINPTGSAIVYSTYLGGTGDDNGKGIALDSTGAAYVIGGTGSTDFPLMNPIQGAYGGGFGDAFVAEINPTGTALVYSTYLGGTGWESGYDIAVDRTGSAYVIGQTLSTNFPLMNPIQSVSGGANETFVTKINSTGAALVYSTYLGGTRNDTGNSIALDSAGAAYVTGSTGSTDFPLMNPIQGVYGGGASDAFITEINSTGTALVYSTFLGGAAGTGGGIDNGNGIAVDSSGAAYVTGETGSTDFPLLNPIQAAIAGISDTFVTKISPAGAALVYSTYLGGSGSSDVGSAIALDSSGSAYVTGSTDATNFPLMNPVQGVYGGGSSDAFVTKIGTQPPVVTLTLVPDAATVAQGVSLGYNVTATNNTAVQQCFNYWENVNLPDGTLFPATDSLLKPVPRLCLNAGASQTAHLTHGVPFTAATGAYVFNSYVGIFPFAFRDIVDTTSFNFNVTAGVAP